MTFEHKGWGWDGVKKYPKFADILYIFWGLIGVKKSQNIVDVTYGIPL